MTKTTNDGTANVALVISDQTSVPDSLAIVQEQLKGLLAISETNYKTGSNWCLPGMKKIQEETTITDLIKLAGFVIEKEKAYYAGAEKLGIASVPVFKLQGATPEEIFHDIKLRIAIVQTEDTKNALLSVQKELTELMDKDDRKLIALAKLKNIASGNFQG